MPRSALDPRGRSVRAGIQLTQVRDGARAVAAIDRAVALLAASDA